MSNNAGTDYINKLTVELTQNVASFIDNFTDLVNFTRASPQFYQAVHSTQSGGLWVQLFANHFDLVPKKLGRELKGVYLLRNKIIDPLVRCKFETGLSTIERVSLEMIRGLIIESFSGISPDSDMASKNVHCLRFIAQMSGILENVSYASIQWPYDIMKWQRASNPLLHVVKVLLLPWFLDPYLNSRVPPVARMMVYSQHALYQNPVTVPLFFNTQMDHLNVGYVLHICNFFKHHLNEDGASPLHGLYTDLDAAMRPQAWTEQLTQGVTPLTAHWRSACACYDHGPRGNHFDFRYFRALRPNVDRVTGDLFFGAFSHKPDEFDEIMLHFHCPLDWIPVFDRHLKGLPHSIPGGTPPPHLTFTGNVARSPTTGISGILHAIPPQEGIPGWQRVSIMRYVLRDPYRFEDLHDDWLLLGKLEHLHCYEAVVLPGGKIMLGRWWNALGDSNPSGPFISWAVE